MLVEIYFGIGFLWSALWWLTVGQEDIAMRVPGGYWGTLATGVLVGLTWPLAAVCGVLGVAVELWNL